jgi:hypothetical protein
MNNEHMHVKCKFFVTIVWNILQEFKFHLYQIVVQQFQKIQKHKLNYCWCQE